MAIRQILVPIVGIADAQRLLQNAFKIAERLNAHVTACDTMPPDYPYLDPTGVVPPDLYEDLTKQVITQQARLRAAAKNQFENAVKQHGIAVHQFPTPPKRRQLGPAAATSTA